MKRIFIILFFTFCIVECSTAQENTHVSIQKLDSLGKVAYYQDDYQQSLHYYQKMLTEIAAKNKEKQYYGYMKHAAALYLEMGNYEQAEKLYLLILDIQKTLKGENNLLYIQCLGQLAYSYYGMGRYDEAEALYLSALKIGKLVLVEEAPTYSSNLNNLALLYNTMGRNEEAEQLYLQVLQIDMRARGGKHYYATSLNNLAGLYHEMERYTEAENLYLKAQKIRKEIYGENHPIYALGLNNIAALYAQIGKHFQAEEFYTQARKILGKGSPHYLYSLNASAKLYSQQKKYALAKKFWLEALDIAKQRWGTEHPGYAQYLDDLAQLYLETNELDKAFDYCFAGIAANSPQLDNSIFDLEQLDKFEYYSNERMSQSLTTLLRISEALYQQNKRKEGLELHYKITKAAMRLNERIRNDFSSSTNKLRILAQNNEFVEKGIYAATTLGGAERRAAAFEFAEQNKSILLLDALKGNRARVLGDLPDSLALQELTLHQQKEKLQQQQFQAATSEEKRAIAISINTLNLDIDLFMKSLEDKYPRYHSLKYQNITAKVEDVQELLEDKSLLLEYFISEEITYLFVVSKEDIELIPIEISRSRINSHVSDLRKSLSDYNMIDDYPEEAYQIFAKSGTWLYQNMLSKALDDKDVENLIIITDGELGHVPFEVFLKEAPKQGGQDYNNLAYLVKDYNISYSYSASLWKENLLQKKTSKENINGSHQQEMLACAADYTKTSVRWTKHRSEHLCNIRKTLETLPAAVSEVETLSNIFRGEFLTGVDANESTFKDLAPNYGVLHLAMHGLLKKDNPMLSSLVFTENLDSLEDNFLQAFEISQLQLNADLVVLSACQTGYGKFEEGEGVISLARSFMYAGVPSLIVSLWQVNDQATAILMPFFYQNLAKGMTKSLALRQAKLKYLETYKGEAAHPAFWSPFIQLGDSRPVKIGVKWNWYWWLVGIGVGLFGLFLITRKLRKNEDSLG